jgi:flagellar biosynthetic protein FlhB
MFGAAIVGGFSGGRVASKLGDHVAASLSRLDGPMAPALAASGSIFVSSVAPVIIGAFLGWLLSLSLQLGWPPTFKTPKIIMPKLFNLGAVLGIISPKAMLGRVANSTAKVIVVGAAAATTASVELSRFIANPALEADMLASRLVAVVVRLGLISAAALAALAVFDFILAKRRMLKKMMMTKQEVKREARESEGDPTIKRRRRQRMRELARRRIANAVKGADVVLVNPTEYAVALRYKLGEDRAPRVVAKGRLVVAEYIRTLARAAGIPIIPEPPLTRLIHKLVPEGREIPAQLYQAVAEVLAYVYKLRNRHRS